MAPYLASARGSFQLLMRDYEAALEYNEFWFPGVSMTIRVPAEWPPITSFG
jgi:hypothetical protein